MAVQHNLKRGWWAWEEDRVETDRCEIRSQVLDIYGKEFEIYL